MPEPRDIDARVDDRREFAADLSECGVLVADAEESERSVQSGRRVHAEHSFGRFNGAE